ncbi:MAG TPA: ABC transporter ATP-binding protein [Acidimicrobiales bacterium]|nr:ABC transporter ATP-binding protein [Acidimicrobiales bacterium]
MTTAVRLTGVSKRFRLYHEKYSSLKERVVHLGRVPYEEFWALRDVDLEVEEGQTWGLLGHNGSGKSTLLKCVAGILQPTTGRIEVRGRLAALLELGAGFHPDLSGRENVFLNASLLGMPRREIEARFDEIVEFAELEQFIDNQVKFYSSGMYMRLGFAVAVNSDPDVLLVDEVLAVGDESFQRKCLDRIRQFQREGRTIVFVTHAPDQVRQICHRALVLDHGLEVSSGTPGEAIRSFREHLLRAGDRSDLARELEEALGDPAGAEAGTAAGDDDGSGGLSTQERKRNFRARITGVRFEHPGEGQNLLPGEPLAIHVQYQAAERIRDPNFGFAIYDIEGNLLTGNNTRILDVDIPQVEGRGEVVFRFEELPLLDGTYFLTLAITSQDEHTVYDWQEQRHQFAVLNPGRAQGMLHLPVHVDQHSDAQGGGCGPST